MKHVAPAVISLAFLSFTSAATRDLGRVFLVLMTEDDASRNSFRLEDNYCLDRVLPRDQSSCRIRVLAPKDSVYSNSRISDMSLDFQHPSRPNTACHVRWSPNGDLATWCEESGSRRRGSARGLPAFRREKAKKGTVSYNDLLKSETKCYNKIASISYYRDGLTGFPEQRPTVIFRTVSTGCVAGIVSGRRANNFRTTEAPCVYNGRRRCRPLTKEQYDSMIRDIEGSETYADFRTSSVRPPLRGGR